MHRGSEFTQILDRIAGGDHGAKNELMPLVYARLKETAARLMQRERAEHTLTATALVNEMYLSLFGATGNPSFESTLHFYNAAAVAMRRHLVDHARERMAQKRGGPGEDHRSGTWKRSVPLTDVPDVLELAARADPEEILRLDAALTRLRLQDARPADVVQLRFFGGLTVEQSAAALGVGTETVKRDWKFARAWLLDQLGGAA